jgi:hypothetical protein
LISDSSCVRIDELPFDLGTYLPDLLVKKSENEGYLIEIKHSAAQTSIERYVPGQKFSGIFKN